MKKSYLYLLLIGISTLSCTKAIIDESTGSSAPVAITKVVKYNPGIKNILFNNCVTCHGGSAPSANLDLSTYNNLKARSSDVKKRMNDVGNPMPQGGLLSLDKRQLLDKWIADGQLEN